MIGVLLAAFLGAQSADAVTTWRSLSSARYVEANPILPHTRGGIVAVKAGVTATTAVAVWKIRKQHPKLAAWILVPAIAAGTVAAVHNGRH